MGLFSKLKKIFPKIEKAAIIGRKVTEAEGTEGIALTLVDIVMEESRQEGYVSAPIEALRAVAVATNDNHEEIEELKKRLDRMEGISAKPLVGSDR